MVNALGVTPIVGGPVRAGGKGLKHDLLGGTPQREHHEWLDALALKTKSLGHTGLVEGMQHAAAKTGLDGILGSLADYAGNKIKFFLGKTRQLINLAHGSPFAARGFST